MTARNDNGPQGYCGFEVGQHIVCVDGDFSAWIAKRPSHAKLRETMSFPAKGVVYTIRDVYVDIDGTRIRLHELHNPPIKWIGAAQPYECGWPSRRFRPLKKLRVEDFLSASTPKDVVGRVPA